MESNEEYKYFEDGSKMLMTKWKQIELDIELLDYKLRKEKLYLSGSDN